MADGDELFGTPERLVVRSESLASHPQTLAAAGKRLLTLRSKAEGVSQAARAEVASL